MLGASQSGHQSFFQLAILDALSKDPGAVNLQSKYLTSHGMLV